jgi:hypothetical protein
MEDGDRETVAVSIVAFIKSKTHPSENNLHSENLETVRFLHAPARTRRCESRKYSLQCSKPIISECLALGPYCDSPPITRILLRSVRRLMPSILAACVRFPLHSAGVDRTGSTLLLRAVALARFIIDHEDGASVFSHECHPARKWRHCWNEACSQPPTRVSQRYGGRSPAPIDPFGALAVAVKLRYHYAGGGSYISQVQATLSAWFCNRRTSIDINQYKQSATQSIPPL